MTTTTVTAMWRKVMAIGLVAGAAALFVPAQAQAQQFAVGVQFGGPVVRGYGPVPVYGPGGFYAHERWERERAEIARHEACERFEAQRRWAQHERWEHGAAPGYWNGR